MDRKFIVDIDNIQVKEFLKNQGFSRAMLRKVRVQNLVYVNGVNVKNYEIVNKGDELIVKINEELNDAFQANHMDLDILYEDEYFLIVNKPNGLSSQPSRKHQFDNLISVITNYYLQKGITTNIHLVTRLDYSTTGIVIVAKLGYAHYEMSKIEILKEYLCIIEGKMEEKRGSIRLPIRRTEPLNIRRCVSEDGQMSITHYQVLQEFADQSLLRIRLETGRTHQIRVHMSYLNHPVVGDELYGHGGKELMLHCFHIQFVHPFTHEVIDIIKYPQWYKEE
jgi:23S rRNA pseudouridine1911/1915/1917 synthase